MTEYALILDAAELRRADFDGDAPTLALNKGKWVPVVRAPYPNFDPLTYAVDQVKTITDDALTEGWSLRPCTAEERAAALAVVNAAVLSEIAGLETLETPRRVAEALPDEAGGSAAGRAWFAANRASITTLRTKLLR